VIRHVVLVIALLLVTARPAHAEDRKAAERLFRAGEQAYRAQSFGAAAANFDEAYKALPLPEIAFSAAQAYRRQFRVERPPRIETAKRAVELYQLYLDQVKQGGRVRDAADSLGEMKREVDALVAAGAKLEATVAPQPPSTRLGISPQLTSEATTMREIADVPDDQAPKIVTKIDGKEVPPFEAVEVTPGPHRISVEAEGYVPVESTVHAVKDERSMKEVVLKPKPAQVTLATERGARVRVDGRPIGTTPLAAIELGAGRHVIAISRDGREPIAREVVVTRGQAITLKEPLEKTTRRKAVPWVVGAAGTLAIIAVASGVGAVIEDGRASDKLAEIRDEGDRTGADAAEYARLVDRRDQLVIGAWTFGGAAVLVGTAAAVMYFFDAPSDDEARVVPAAIPGGAAVTFGGRF